jgi:hypothetical protein
MTFSFTQFAGQVLGVTAVCAALAPASSALAMGVPIKLDTVADYDVSIEEARVANGTISIHTCSTQKNPEPGTDARVLLTIWDKGGDKKAYWLDNPGSDRGAGESDTYAFHFPHGSVGQLKKFEVRMYGYDLWCVDHITLKAGSDTLMDYNITGQWLLSTEWGESQVSSIMFSDELVDRSLNGHLTPEGQELRRDADWYMHDIHLVDGWSYPVCQLPSKITAAELKREVETQIGDMLAESDGKYRWGNGGVNLTVKTTGAHPVYHADVTFKADAPVGADATVNANFDIMPACDPSQGFRFSVTTPQVHTSLSAGTKAFILFLEVLSADVSMAVTGVPIPYAKFMIPKPPTTGPAIDPILFDQTFCPAFSVASNNDLLMTWPANVKVEQLELSDAKKAALGLQPGWIFTLPDNPLCVDMNSITKK